MPKYTMEVEYIFKGTVTVLGDNEREAENSVNDFFGVVINNPHTSNDRVIKDWEFGTHPTDETCKIIDTKFDLSFKTDGERYTECCPNCISENEVLGDASTDCEHCTEKNLIPCRPCSDSNPDMCDFKEETGCTPFPRKKE